MPGYAGRKRPPPDKNKPKMPAFAGQQNTLAAGQYITLIRGDWSPHPFLIKTPA